MHWVTGVQEGTVPVGTAPNLEESGGVGPIRLQCGALRLTRHPLNKDIKILQRNI